MGQNASRYNQEELAEFQDLTYFTKREVLHVHKRFCALSPEKAKAERNPVLTKPEILSLPELAANPFNERILDVFSQTGDGRMNFEEFLDMMSQFSSKAPLNTKIDIAFRIYDFNDDGEICEKDLEKVVLFLIQPSVTGGNLSTEDRQKVVNNVIREMDMDDDGTISYLDFKHGMSKLNGFEESFKITL